VVLTDGAALAPPGDAEAVGEGEAVEHADCAKISMIASALAIGAAARFPEGARRQKLSACLRCGQGCIGQAEANR
jgi:hypothetical protein